MLEMFEKLTVIKKNTLNILFGKNKSTLRNEHTIWKEQVNS